jgi:hypothetical protein
VAGMMALLGSGFILLTSLALMVAFVLRTPRAVRNQERQAIEAELATINDALGAFGRGSPIAIIKKPNGALVSVTRADFSSLVAQKRRLIAKLRQHK